MLIKYHILSLQIPRDNYYISNHSNELSIHFYIHIVITMDTLHNNMHGMLYDIICCQQMIGFCLLLLAPFSVVCLVSSSGELGRNGPRADNGSKCSSPLYSAKA